MNGDLFENNWGFCVGFLVSFDKDDGFFDFFWIMFILSFVWSVFEYVWLVDDVIS